MVNKSPAQEFGALLAKELQKNPHFYFFSPDETTSNKFDQVFEVEKRAWGLPTRPQDLPESPDGRIVEMLSENVLFSVMAGHLTNGETAMLGSYEAFLSIITAQLLQQIKFIKQAKAVSWREPLPAVNLLSTSTCWRQDHNGFTHQSPALISTLLELPSNLVNCWFPLDVVAVKPIFEFMLRSQNVVNLTTFNKIEQPCFLGENQAAEAAKTGVTVFGETGEEPDIVMVAAGDLMAKETLAAIKILQEDLPELKIRFVYLSALSYQAIGTTEHKLSQADFDRYFGKNCPIVANFHGYPATLEHILARYAPRERLLVHGYLDEGSTTTPFEMLRRNKASRYDLATEVAELATRLNAPTEVAEKARRSNLAAKYQKILAENHQYAVQHGEDMIK